MKFRTSVYATLLNPIFQSKEFEGSGGLMVEIIILIYIFFGFGVMCDKYLIPAIEKIKERYQISERLAGSTILALGSSISLIASNMNAVLLNKPSEFELGLTAILGAAIFEFTIGFAIGCMLIRKNYKISYNILARDILVYLGIMVLLYFFLKQKLLDLTKSIILLCLWVVYMIYLILTSREENSDHCLVIMNKSDSKDLPDKKDNKPDYHSTHKTNFTKSNEAPKGYSNADYLETQNSKEEKPQSKKTEKPNKDANSFANVKQLRNAEKNILDNFNGNNCENNHNTSHNSNEISKHQDSNKSHSNCECYDKKYFNITDISNTDCNQNDEKNQALEASKLKLKEDFNNCNKNNNNNNNFNIGNTAVSLVKQIYFNNMKENLNANPKTKEDNFTENNCEAEDQKALLPVKIDVEKLNRYKHIYIKNLYLKLNSNEALLPLFVKGFLKATAKPWEMLLDLFTPKSNEGAYLIIKFIIPLFFIWNFSEVELFILEKVMSRLKVPASFLGLTIMSWGNNAPDMYNVASAMAKGLVDLALNAAIASEIHNILLGLGLPWLVYNLTYSKPIEFQMNDLYAFTIFFFCVFLLIFLLALKFNRNKFDYRLAVFLILIYLVFLILIFVLSFNIKLW